MPVDMYTVTLALLALQREDGVGAPRRRGGDRRVVDGGRRPSKNDNSSNAGAVSSSASASEPELDGTGDDGTGPTGRPIGVFACGMMRLGLF